MYINKFFLYLLIKITYLTCSNKLFKNVYITIFVINYNLLCQSMNISWVFKEKLKLQLNFFFLLFLFKVNNIYIYHKCIGNLFKLLNHTK